MSKIGIVPLLHAWIMGELTYVMHEKVHRAALLVIVTGIDSS